MADVRQFQSPITWRRKKQPESLLASATRVNLDSRKSVRQVLSYRQDWQTQAMDDTYAIGELQYGVSVPASLVARITFFAALPPDQTDGQPTRLKETDKLATPINAVMDQLGNVLSRADFQYDLALNFLVPGECYVVCFGARPEETDRQGNKLPESPERWVIRSIREVSQDKGSIKTWDDFRDTEVTLDQTKGDTFIRVWRPDPFNHKLATSHIRSILGPAEELLHWDAAAVAAAKSRLVLAGLLGIPKSLDVTPENDQEARLSGSARFISRFLKEAERRISNPNLGSAAVPMLFEYPDNDKRVSGLEKIEFDRPNDDLLEKRTDRVLQRIEQGINLPAGVISGLGHATHWGGGQIEESVFRDHVEPLVLFICSALTKSFLIPTLRENNVADPEKYLIWYDASSLIVHRDKAANALRAFESGAIDYPALRRELGLSENDALDDPESRQEIFDWLTGLRRGTVQAPVERISVSEQDPNAPPTQNAPGGRTPTEQKIAPLKGTGQSPLPGGGKVAASANGHNDLIWARLQVLCDEKCRRALERAGNKLRNRAKGQYKQAIYGIKPERVASTLGRETVIKLGQDDLFEEAFTDFHSRLLALLPTDVLAIDTTRPVQNLVKELRIICTDALFKPPTAEPLVPIQVIAKALETLALDDSAA